jgi:prepilin-type N-terminal cleavage/methylation domain-containing protein
MNMKSKEQHINRGYTLIEVLVGIVIFALGMLALASLQGNLARNSGDSNARTVANNIAEEVIEATRTFSQIPSDPDGIADAFEDIQDGQLTIDGQQTIERGGVNYTITSEVTNYYYDNATGSFTTTKPLSVPYGDMKLVELTVSWNDSQEFQIDESQTTTGRLGSGSITLTDLISSITSPSGGKVALISPQSNAFAPPVDYNPGANPDIISIQLGDNKFKESTTPLPDVLRTDELVETRFDVVTYSQDDAGATFLRREEFRALTCECTLRIPSSGSTTAGGLRPTVWNGYEYSQAEFVAKAYGESALNQQNSFCSLCCRDHHDGGTGEEDVVTDPGLSLYDPFRSASEYYGNEYSGVLAGDHKHYSRNDLGELVLADSDGDIYVEACRMARKDGFFRIAQDLRQEGLNSFPADYLDESSEVSQYSGYVTAAVSKYESEVGNDYELAPPSLTGAAYMPSPIIFPASTPAVATTLPTPSGSTEQQLRARGIYIDYMSDELRKKINCLDAGGDGDSCEAPNVTSALEIIPFYDVQLTWLSRWNETPNNNPVDVTNDAIESGNSHSRGNAMLQFGFGDSIVSSMVHKGNLGLTGTDPIDPWYTGDEKEYLLYALAYNANPIPGLTDTVIAGTITSAVGAVKAADVVIEATGAQCDRTNTGFECYLEVDANNPRLTISNYYKAGRVLVGCSAVLNIHGSEISNNNWTRFDLPSSTTNNANIVIKENNC